MFKQLGKLLTGDPDQRDMDRYTEKVVEINALEAQLEQLTDEELAGKTAEFKQRLAAGETLDDLLVEAFAVVREVSVRKLGMRHFDIQMIGGMVLHEGRIAEMRTGEGKTLVATLPLYLNALVGKGVHLITVNDYLARRDARWMGPIFHFLGMSVGILQSASRTESGRKGFLYNPEREAAQEDIHQMEIVARSESYAADITYGTNNEFGFDYLRDNMARTLEARSQRGHNYALLDEVDNILIDEARTPLIISGPSHEEPETYQQMAKVVRQMRPEDYEISEKDRTVVLNDIGISHVEELLGMPLRDPDRPEDISPEQARMLGYLEQALRAEFLFKRNKDYVAQGGKVIIVDEFTGRLMPGRRWSDGLHQAVEAKEGVKVGRENVTYATITLQNYFRMYTKLAGMTGTAVTESEEFNKIYEVDVFALPTNLEYVASLEGTDLEAVEYKEENLRFVKYIRPGDPEEKPIFWKRKDYPDVVFRTEEAKLRAIVLEILRRHVYGQPLLVGTTSVELSELLSSRLRADALQKLANIMILRREYMHQNDIEETGLRINELLPLYAPLDQLPASELRTFARSLGLSLNPAKPENLQRLGEVLDLGSGYHERIAAVLKSGIRHNVLNAKRHTEESQIIAGAGEVGAVTIATNMAGRGVDIKLGGELAEEVLGAVNRVLRRIGVENPTRLSVEERLAALENADDEAVGIYGPEIELFRQYIDNEKLVREVGGLHVIGSERHDARRIDNQLRGRAARQGDPGSSQFYLSMQDELMRLFGGEQVGTLMQRLNIDDALPVAHNIVDRRIEQAQTRVEGANFDTRKHLLEYDDVLNQQREVFYSQRNRVFTKGDLSEDIASMVVFEIERRVNLAAMDPDGPWKLLAWLEEIQPTLSLESDKPYPSFMLQLLLEKMEADSGAELKESFNSIVEDALQSHYDHLAESTRNQFDTALDRLKDQVSQRVELAETAMDGILLEAEESGNMPRVDDLLSVVEQTAGLRLQMDEKSRDAVQQDPDKIRRMLPQFVEASLGLRIWAGMIRTIEARLGESLNLDKKLKSPIDWNQASDDLNEAFESAWNRRADRIRSDVERDLNRDLKSQEVTDALKLRLLVQLSYGQRMVFDRKTHQRQSVRVGRFSYAFTAARLIEGLEPEELSRRILDHLQGAQAYIEQTVGESETIRLGTQSLKELNQPLQDAIRERVGKEDFEKAAQSESLLAMPEAELESIREALGGHLMMEFYRRQFLSTADRAWVDYLTQMEALRTSIGLEAYGQRDPLVQYKSRAFDMFQQLLDEIRSGMVSRMYRVRLAARGTGTASRVNVGADQKAAASRSKSSGKKRRRRRR